MRYNLKARALGTTLEQWLRTRMAVQLVRMVGWVLRVEVTSPNLEPIEVNPDYRPVQVDAGLAFKALFKQRLRELQGPRRPAVRMGLYSGLMVASKGLGKAYDLQARPLNPELVSPFELFPHATTRRDELIEYELEVHRLMAIHAPEHTRLTPTEREQLDLTVEKTTLNPQQFVDMILRERAAQGI